MIDQSNKVRKKVISKNIEKYLTPLAIAHWVMGNDTYEGGKHKRVTLCIDNFKLEEVNLLRNILLKQYDIISRIKRVRDKQYRITITGENRIKFQDLVDPFIIPSLKYRTGL